MFVREEKMYNKFSRFLNRGLMDVLNKSNKRESQRETDRQTKTGRERDSQREREIQTDRQTGRERETERERERERETDLPEAYTSAVSNRFTPFSYAMVIRFSAVCRNQVRGTANPEQAHPIPANPEQVHPIPANPEQAYSHFILNNYIFLGSVYLAVRTENVLCYETI